jgi:hypothetical protein
MRRDYLEGAAPSAPNPAGNGFRAEKYGRAKLAEPLCPPPRTEICR